MKLPNKIRSLNKLNKSILIPKYIYFNFYSFKKKKKKILSKIQKNFKKKIIIRSASFDEDNKISMAGKFLSIGNISSKDTKIIDKSINDVFRSYKTKTNQFILVQEYFDNADLVGVIFSADPKNSSPFRTINFNESNSTDLITSGKSNGKILYYYRNIKKLEHKKKIIYIENTLKKIEKKFKNLFLDVEFLIFKKKIYILQIRQLKINNKQKINFENALANLEKKISKLQYEKSNLIGKQRFFSTMTDWNPAEIIGLKPKKLAESLYKSLITDEIWLKSRIDLGYKKIENTPLLYSLFGTPYIDIKTDINSFLISSLPIKTQQKLINSYLNKFKKKSLFYYDKIESSLVINAVSLDIEKYKKLISDSKLTKKEQRNVIAEYIKLTSSIILKLEENIKLYESGEELFKTLNFNKNPIINQIFLYHEFCKKYGTFPFANLARMAFIAVEFLNSFVSLKIITNEEKKYFLETNKSISLEMNHCLKKSKQKFLKEYGHLRPNTYEILTPNYRENYKIYFKKIRFKTKKNKKFKFSKYQKEKINILLKKNNFKNIDADILINFIEKSIYHREKSKLFFTKIVNKIFILIKIFARKTRLNFKDTQYLDINSILDLYNNFSNKYLKDVLDKKISENKKEYNFNLNFNLPNVILKNTDIYLYEEENASPTFISNKIVSSDFIIIKDVSKKLNLNNKIVCIEYADPGYDFIFNYKINGLITAFGGPNSHMSIRCNEFSIPAVIGLGEKKFQQIIKHNRLYLNCVKKILTGI